MNKKKFLKLHSNDDNSVIIVCLDEIIFIYTDTNNGGKVTTVYLNNETVETITVNETPEKIYQFILETCNIDFVKLHSSDDNSVIVVNVDSISLICLADNNMKSLYT